MDNLCPLAQFPAAVYLEQYLQAHHRFQSLDFSDYSSSVGRMSRQCLASLRYFLPDQPNHEQILRRVLLNQELSRIDECLVEQPTVLQQQLAQTEITDPQHWLTVAASGKPVLFCTFHYGSYGLINGLLATQGIDFALPVSSQIFQQLKPRYDRNMQLLQEQSPATLGKMQLLDAESSTLLLQLRRKVKAGHSLLFYLDGNAGVGGMQSSNENMTPIRWFDQSIQSRIGLSFISHFLQIPIVPVLCYRRGLLQNTLYFGDALQPQMQEATADVHQQVTQQLFDFLATFVRKDPSQWEAWMYLHRFISTPPLLSEPKTIVLDNDKTLSFNHQKYQLLKYGSQLVVFDSSHFRYFTVPTDCSAVVEDLYRQPLDADQLAAWRPQLQQMPWIQQQ